MLIGIITGFIIGTISWRVNLLVLQRLIDKGKAQAFFFGVGAFVADAIYLTIALFGIEYWINIQKAKHYLEWIAAGTFLVLGLHCFVIKPQKLQNVNGGAVSALRSFAKGFASVGGMPVLVLFWMIVLGAMYSNFPHQTQVPWFRWLFPVGFVIGGGGWILGFVGLMPERVQKLCQIHAQLFLRIIGGILLLGSIAVFWGS